MWSTVGYGLCSVTGSVEFCSCRDPSPARGHLRVLGSGALPTGAVPAASQARSVPGHSPTPFSLPPQASDGQWYQMNDNVVRPSNIKVVLNQQAYVLFYLR